MTRSIDYGGMMRRAMQGLIANVLRGIAEHGLSGEHHFFITFDTREDGVEIADWLRERYPTEMTIVIQHWYDDLEVTDDGFSIILNFGNSPERLVIPFDALRTFVDPSVEFGLRFDTQESDEEDDGDEDAEPDPAPEEDAPKSGAEVVSLDKWRK
ncbi:MAG: ClpXP protease specificity-enhancing factor SspB [Paracoccus sp. (in: a-proteobacteria)]|nr:ClpXP protease specificity-enhancing factor SspB [Paracoccus sp. (in: a-proteobacteria)]